MAWPLAAVFDFDGLLVDTADCWQRAYTQTLAASGRKLRPAIAQRLAGASVEAAATTLRVPVRRLTQSLHEAFQDASLETLPGAPELLRALEGRAKLAVATNAPRDLVREALNRIGVSGHFSAVLSAEPPRKPKPAPDVYLDACQTLGVPPSQAAALEDSPIGVLAARRAGLIVIRVSPDGHADAGADLYVPRLDDTRLRKLLNLP